MHIFAMAIAGVLAIGNVASDAHDDAALWSLVADLKTNVSAEINAIRSDTKTFLKDLLQELDHFEDHVNDRIATILEHAPTTTPKPENPIIDCDTYVESFRKNWITNGEYYIKPDAEKAAMYVYCEFDDDGSWLVFQRRLDGSADFNRDWDDYALGFGNLSAEHWLGNWNLNVITSAKPYELRVELEDWDGDRRIANYDYFHVANESEQFRLTLGEFSGDAYNGMITDSGNMFSTRDRDNDLTYDLNQAEENRGAWWYTNLSYARLNNPYSHNPRVQPWGGIVWFHWKGYNYSLKYTQMKIRPKRP